MCAQKIVVREGNCASPIVRMRMRLIHVGARTLRRYASCLSHETEREGAAGHLYPCILFYSKVRLICNFANTTICICPGFVALNVMSHCCVWLFMSRIKVKQFAFSVIAVSPNIRNPASGAIPRRTVPSACIPHAQATYFGQHELLVCPHECDLCMFLRDEIYI